jgi:DNA-binding transcriptional MerR regulator
LTLADGTVYVSFWRDDEAMLSLGLHDIPLINFAIKCNTVDYVNTKMEWFWDRDSMTVKQFTKYGKNFIKALKDAGYSKSQIEQVIEEGREGLTSTIVDWNRSEISYRSRLDDGLYKFDGVEFKMPNGSKYQEKCRLIEFKEQEQKTKKKKPIKRDKELDNLKKEADVMSRNAAACHINSTGNTRKLLGEHINYLYSLVQNSKLPGYGNEQMYRQIISASDTILKLGKCN